MLVTEPLCGLEFDMEKRNCYQAMRAFYKLNYDIELTDYPCPTNWWNGGLDLFAVLAAEEGFSVVNEHPNQWHPGDVLIMAIGSTKGNHCAVLLPGNKIFHHLVGQRSIVTSYGSLFRNNLLAVYRHKDVPVGANTVAVDIREKLAPHARRRLEERIARRAAERAAPTGP